VHLQQLAQWEKLLKIKTSGRDDSRADSYHHPYEPTPYVVLERLANVGYIGKKNTLLDYGCGKGRVDFFFSYQTRCRTIGIEYDERIYRSALDNRKTAVSSERTEFVCGCAEQYTIPDHVDRIYFFNPFSVEILKKVLGRIRESCYVLPRNILLFFYYPSEEYQSFLMTLSELEFMEEVDCRDLFEGADDREKVLVFSMGSED
jgi:SAM-dependent methyltransferase